MWTSEKTLVEKGRGEKFFLLEKGQKLCHAEVWNLWENSADFRSFYISLLAQSSFQAYRWETPGVTIYSQEKEFEFILVNSPSLERNARSSDFAEHFEKASPGEEVISFPNLGRDAVLIVPCPLESPSIYAHLAAFTRQASESQKHSFWGLIGALMRERVSKKTIWLNTAGMGVPWLHIRLDSRPKYYSYRPYAQRES